MISFLYGLLKAAAFLFCLVAGVWMFSVYVTRQLAKLSRLKYFMKLGELSSLGTLASVPRRTVNSEEPDEESRPTIIGLFHPYCHAGGGGERVLWMALKSLQEHFQGKERLVHLLVFTGDEGVLPDEFYERAKQRFNIELDGPVEFIYLKRRYLVEDRTYPYATLLLQSFGGFLLGLEAFSYVVPDIFIDTMGYSFTYPLFKYLGQSEVACYVHYPTISYDMLEVVRQRTPTYNNNSAIAQSPIMSRLKEFYYEYFATAYGFAGRCADVVMANSSWTKMHLDIIWEAPQKVKIVYPPCDTANFSKFPLKGRGNLIISIAQFRPEKNHKMQLDAFHKYVSSPGASQDARLMLIGGARNEKDLVRVKALEDHANKLELGGRVAIVVNMPFSELKKMLSSAKIGLHSMWNEHFGIGVVEYMAAGCITVAHNSGGPKMDIIVPYGSQPTGFLASTVEEYADTFKQIYEMCEEDCLKMQEAARANVCERFSEDIFSRKFISSLSPLLKKLELG